MPSPRVTVAVITYNRSRRLRETLAGMVRQNFPAGGWELLVIDNNSTDDTGEVVSSFVSSVPSPRRVVEARQGLDHGRNRAIAESRGE
ncbi:MAG TPA: glycosyltransferase, partial [Opitutaceae bacterium]|nr:glycosyltransferase [Opitutaceae bacterium]